MPLPHFIDYSLRFIAPISLGLATYYHYQSVQQRVPTYHFSPAHARIVDTSMPALPQLQILYKGKDLNANVRLRLASGTLHHYVSWSGPNAKIPEGETPAPTGFLVSRIILLAL